RRQAERYRGQCRRRPTMSLPAMTPDRSSTRRTSTRCLSSTKCNYKKFWETSVNATFGGSVLAKLTALQNQLRQVMRTPYGEPSGALTFGEFAGAEVVFLARHGYGHTLSPHEINYRANIWALKELKVEGVIAVATVGGIRDDLVPGSLVLPDQIIDHTHSRKSTFFEGSEMPVTHVDFTQPYSQVLRAGLIAAATACHEKLFDGAVYACTQGPRLETAAEIERIPGEGGDGGCVHGMPADVAA